MSSGRPGQHRRRSLKALLQISNPPGPSRSTNASTSGTVSIVDDRPPVIQLPSDVVIEIAERLINTSDVLNLSLACTSMHGLLLPLLYNSVVLKSSAVCRQTLPFLLTRPDLCTLIRKFAVRPNWYLAWPRKDEPIDEDWVASMIERIAPMMDRLDTIDWDGLEMPKDSAWKALRENCPLLKTIYVNVGHKPLNSASELFDFTNLTTFSLTVRYGLGGSEIFPAAEQLPERLWSMLSSSPDLSELALSSFSTSSRTFNIAPLLSLTLPNLKSLTLGAFGYNEDFTLSSPASLPEFLSKLEHLEFLRLGFNFKRWVSPELILLMLPPTSLLNLTTFAGVYQYLLEFPEDAVQRLESIDLTCEPVYEPRIVYVQRALARCAKLRSLDIWVSDLGGPCVGVLTGLKDANVEELSWMCTSVAKSAEVESLAQALAINTPQLKVLSITRGHRYYGRDDNASRLLKTLRALRNLERVNVRFARERCLGHLKMEGEYEFRPDGGVNVFERGIKSRIVGSGVFERRFKLKAPRGRNARRKLEELGKPLPMPVVV